jgi:AhpD family alkylhydroperoxidase
MIASVIAGALVGQMAVAQKAPVTAKKNEAVLKDIETTLGFVPGFIKSASDALLPSLWLALKDVQMGETALDGKTKELIGLAVAAQIPCEYCVYFHTEAARANGANEQQIKEAIAMASVTRMASTVLNGSQVDVAQFKKDTQRMLKGHDGKKPSTASR